MERPIESKTHPGKTTIIARSTNEAGMKVIEKYEVKTRNDDTLRYVHKKLEDKGLRRRDKHPVDGKGLKKPPPKQGHGGKFTWEGPGGDLVELDDMEEVMPGAADENDPNYVDEIEEKVKGDVEAAKVVEQRIGMAEYVDPRLKLE